MTTFCSYCGKSPDVWDSNMTFIRVTDVQFREFMGTEQQENYMCFECLKGRLK